MCKRFIQSLLTLLFFSGMMFEASQAADDLLIDPTAPPTANEVSPGVRAMALESVMMQGDQAYAVINGKTVSKGQRVDGATVLTVENARVEIERNKKHEWLTLFETVEVKAVDTKKSTVEILLSNDMKRILLDINVDMSVAAVLQGE